MDDRSRDEIISAGLAQFLAAPGAWNKTAAKKLIEDAGRAEYDENVKDAFGRYPSENGFPITTHRGHIVSFCHALPSANGGGPAFCPPAIFDGGAK